MGWWYLDIFQPYQWLCVTSLFQLLLHTWLVHHKGDVERFLPDNWGAWKVRNLNRPPKRDEITILCPLRWKKEYLRWHDLSSREQNQAQCNTIPSILQNQSTSAGLNVQFTYQWHHMRCDRFLLHVPFSGHCVRESLRRSPQRTTLWGEHNSII